MEQFILHASHFSIAWQPWESLLTNFCVNLWNEQREKLKLYTKIKHSFFYNLCFFSMKLAAIFTKDVELHVKFVRAYDRVKQQIQCTADNKSWHDEPQLILQMFVDHMCLRTTCQHSQPCASYQWQSPFWITTALLVSDLDEWGFTHICKDDSHHHNRCTSQF